MYLANNWLSYRVDGAWAEEDVHVKFFAGRMWYFTSEISDRNEQKYLQQNNIKGFNLM